MIPPSPGFARASCTSKVTFTAESAGWAGRPVPQDEPHERRVDSVDCTQAQAAGQQLRRRLSVLPRHDQQQPVRRRMGLHEDADLRQPHGPEARHHLPLAGEGVHCPQNGRRWDNGKWFAFTVSAAKPQAGNLGRDRPDRRWWQWRRRVDHNHPDLLHRGRRPGDRIHVRFRLLLFRRRRAALVQLLGDRPPARKTSRHRSRTASSRRLRKRDHGLGPVPAPSGDLRLRG